MTSPIVSIGEKASLSTAVRLLQKHRIKRLVVLDPEGQVVGVVSRRDLLSAFTRSDDDIRADVTEGVIPRWLMVDPAGVHVHVHRGVVHLSGTVERRSDAEVLTHLVRGLDGVVEVDSDVTYRLDDHDLELSRELRVS